jgi:hypothetical protein
MSLLQKDFKIEGSTPASATTAIVGDVRGLDKYDWFQISAKLVGGTGGTLDVYLQRWIESDLWEDWIHFPQVAATATKYFAATATGVTDPVEVGRGSDASPGVSLAAGKSIGGHPGRRVRAVAVAGAGTTVAGSVRVDIKAFEQVS